MKQNIYHVNVNAAFMVKCNSNQIWNNDFKEKLCVKKVIFGILRHLFVKIQY